MSLESPASGWVTRPNRAVLVQKSRHVDDDIQNFALCVFYEMDGRKSRYIKEVMDWYRQEDAGDVRGNELN